MIMKLFARCALAAAAATIVFALATDVSFAAKKQAGGIAPGSCKVTKGYIPGGQACTGAPNQYGVSQMNWCSFGSLTPGIWCSGAMCPALKC
jgi:hypothetical protein